MSRQSRTLLAAAFAAALVMADDAFAQYVIFAPGTDPAYKQQVLDAVAARRARLGGIDRFDYAHRWVNSSMTGDPIGITWSIVPDGTGPIPKLPENFFEPAFSNAVTFTELDNKFGGRDTWLAIIQDAFQQVEDPEATPGSYNTWGNVSGLNFTQINHSEPDPENPGQIITYDWDSGATWDDTGSSNGLLLPEGGGGLPPADPMDPGVGDIRIAMKPIDNGGGVLGYAYPPDDPLFPGEICLDSKEDWTRSDVDYRYMRNIITQMIGFAVGLDFACPEILQRVMEPFSGFGFTGPQVDDIRGVQFLYGDYLEPDDVPDPAIATMIQVEPQQSLLGDYRPYDRLSIDSPTDQDAFIINFPDLETDNYDFDLLVTVTPVGTEYLDGPSTDSVCAGDFDTIDALALRNLKVGVYDATLANYDVFDCESTTQAQPLPTDVGGFVNETDAGETECVATSINQPGDYYVVISSNPEGGVSADQPQLYSVTFQIGNRIFNQGISFDNVCLAYAPDGLGANRMNNAETSIPGVLAGEQVYRGKSSRVGNVEDRHPSLGHPTTQYLNGPLIFQDFPPQRIAWPGNALAPAALGGVSSHATAAVACAVGNPQGTFPASFVGPAFEASWLSASVAVRAFGDGEAFITSNESLLYGLFGLTNPETALELGLPTTATVLNNSWGGGGDSRGDSSISLAYDAVVFMTDVPAIVAAGNEGGIDNTPQCGGFGGNTPGSIFRGSRTVTFPATAFNTIAVGMAGKVLPDDTSPVPEAVNPFTDDYTHVVDASSKGPIDSFDFDAGNTQFNTRPGIDVLSIGTGYILEGMNPLEQQPNPGDPCNYMGHPSVIGLSLPNIPFTAPDPDNPPPDDPSLFLSSLGTSFASPAVAGAVALLQDYATDHAIHLNHNVIRAMLLTGARKFEGWSNDGNPARPQDNRDGRKPLDNDDTVNRETTQALDYAQGAGFADLKRSYEILRGVYDKPELAGFITGPPSTDILITDPDFPIINTPPNERLFATPIPISGAGFDSVDELPRSPIEIADLLRKSREGYPQNPILRVQGDFGDPDIGQVGGDKSAAGINFNAREPFKLPPNPNRPDFKEAEPPLEIPVELRIVVNPIGWDHAQLGQRSMNLPPSGNFQGGRIRAGYIDYFIAFAFDGVGDYIDATLCWDRAVEMAIPDFTDIDNPVIGEMDRLELENLDLELIQTDAVGSIVNDNVVLGTIGTDQEGVVWSYSRSTFSNVEHIHTRTDGKSADDDDEIMPAGFYTLRVRWVNSQGFTGQEYDLFDNSTPGEVEFGLAWRVEPTESSDPEGTGGGETLLASSALSPSTQALRVLNMYLDAFDTREGDADFNKAFDVNRDGAVDVLDFGPIARFWFSR